MRKSSPSSAREMMAGAAKTGGQAPTRRVLGIDPGSQFTGYGVVEQCGARLVAVTAGVVAPRVGSLAVRLAAIAGEVEFLIETWRPESVALERAFVGKNSASALRIGEVRGAVLAAVGRAGLELTDYPPATVKVAVAGSGRAEKEAVAKGVALLTGSDRPAGDASDALAIAICHLRHSAFLGRAKLAVGGRG